MENSYHFKFFKYFLIILLIYNIISLLVLFTPGKSLKYDLWKLMPYDYKNLVNYPTYLNRISLLTSANRNLIKDSLQKNLNRNSLDIDYWNYNLIIDNYSKENNKNFEKSYLNLFFLTQNNPTKNLDLKKYFISNYNFFSEENKKIILENY